MELIDKQKILKVLQDWYYKVGSNPYGVGIQTGLGVAMAEVRLMETVSKEDKENDYESNDNCRNG